jgi:hypothetical protein
MGAPALIARFAADGHDRHARATAAENLLPFPDDVIEGAAREQSS